MEINVLLIGAKWNDPNYIYANEQNIDFYRTQ